MEIKGKKIEISFMNEEESAELERLIAEKENARLEEKKRKRHEEIKRKRDEERKTQPELFDLGD